MSRVDRWGGFCFVFTNLIDLFEKKSLSGTQNYNYQIILYKPLFLHVSLRSLWEKREMQEFNET